MTKMYDPEMVARVAELYGAGLTMSNVANRLGTTTKVIFRLMHNHGIKSRVARQKDKWGNNYSREMRATPEFLCWKNMHDRCINPNHRAYHNYGGRGITVCERWRKFENFLEDVGPRPTEIHSLDRWPDNNGHYEPGNVRWATPKQQIENRRPRSEWRRQCQSAY